MVYSLADYILTIKIPTLVKEALGLETDEISIGGKQSYVGSITLPAQEMFAVDGDATGSYWHTQKFDRHGDISVTVNRTAPVVKRLEDILNVYYSAEDAGLVDEGFIITVEEKNHKEIAVANACYLKGRPQRTINAEGPDSPSFSFACGEIIYK